MKKNVGNVVMFEVLERDHAEPDPPETCRSGYCRVCGRSVDLDDIGNCANGHPSSDIVTCYADERTRLLMDWTHDKARLQKQQCKDAIAAARREEGVRETFDIDVLLNLYYPQDLFSRRSKLTPESIEELEYSYYTSYLRFTTLKQYAKHLEQMEIYDCN